MKTTTIEYFHNQTLLEGYMAYEESLHGPRPAVLIAHDWTGRNELACEKAKQLAKLGYVGFALDMFGKGILGTTKEEKMKLIQPFMADRIKLQNRIHAALEVLVKQECVKKEKIAAMGFCFGGLCALDLARMGADIKGVISFHGLLNPPDKINHSKIKAKVLVLHGYDDPMVPPEQLNNFAKEMTHNQVDWQAHVYGGTMHAFTNPQAQDPDFGTVYNATADKRSWQAMQNFLLELFADCNTDL